uniref:Uncharacterized protein n=1 Tax=Romanomermis culicivorax TaxID=13658 RepID=A0A915HJZ2_ROMCU
MLTFQRQKPNLNLIIFPPFFKILRFATSNQNFKNYNFKPKFQSKKLQIVLKDRTGRDLSIDIKFTGFK